MEAILGPLDPVKPELTGVQLVPLFVERKTPPCVPAKRFVPMTARYGMLPPPGPLVGVHCATDELMPQTTTSINNTNRKRFFTDVVPFN